MKLLIIAFLISFNIQLSAQIDDLLRDDNIVWVGECMTDYVVEGYKALDTINSRNGVKLLKYLNTNSSLNSNLYDDEQLPFFSKIKNNISYDFSILYKDSACKTKTNPLARVDTIEMVDPITYEKRLFIRPCCFCLLQEPLFYKVRQILYYDKKKKNFGLRVLAIGLIKNKLNDYGDTIGLEEYGWLKPNNIMGNKPNLNNSNITIAKRLVSRLNSPSFEKDFKVLKNTIENIQKKFIDDLKQKPSIALYTDYYLPQISKKDRQSYLESFQPIVETVRTFIRDSINKPDTSENRIVVDRDFPDFATGRNIVSGRDSISYFTDKREIIKLKIIQDWYWDEKLNTISIRLFAVAPMIKIYDDAGNYLYDRAVFYRLND